MRKEANTKTAVAASKGQTVKVTVYRCANGVPAVPDGQACCHVAVRASKARGVKSGHQKRLNRMADLLRRSRTPVPENRPGPAPAAPALLSLTRTPTHPPDPTRLKQIPTVTHPGHHPAAHRPAR